MFRYSVRSMSSDEQPSEKVPLVSVKFDSLAKLLFHRTFDGTGSNTSTDVAGSRDSELNSPSRNSVRYHYEALDCGLTSGDRNRRDPVEGDRAAAACQAWLQECGDRYELISELCDIGSRCNKNWFLIQDNGVRTNRLLALQQLPKDNTTLHELSHTDSRAMLMDVLGNLKHPYIYPVLDLGILNTTSAFVALVMPNNAKGSLKDIIYRCQWSEPFTKKYSRNSVCLPVTQVQRLGRQILEALIFLKERGFHSHGHLHSGNVIIQNGVARLTGIENNLLGLNSRVNAVMWAKTKDELDSVDIISFGHLLFEMCAGYELSELHPSKGHLQLDLERYPGVIEILNLIFDYPDGGYPSIEEIVLHEFFRNIDLREMRGMGHNFTPALANSTLLMNAMRRRPKASEGGHSSSPCIVGLGSGSLSDGNISPCSSPPLTPRERGVLFV